MGLGMRRLLAALCVAGATMSVGWAADVPVAAPAVAPLPPWNVTISSEVRYFSWQGNRGFPVSVAPANDGGRGAELYVPLAVQLAGRLTEDLKLEFLTRGGWVWARQSTAGLSGEIATATDIVSSGTATYLGFNGIQPFASVNLNLPTGTSALFGTAANARMDPDLVDIATFGEGLNVGPTLGFNLPITSSLIVTASAGYTRRGDYERESTLAPVPGAPPPTVQRPTEIEPGDVFTGTSSVGYQAGPFVAKLTASITETRPTIENGMPLYKAGRRYLAAGTWSYAWPEWGTTTLTAAAAHSNRNEVLFAGATALITEAMNTNSNLYRVGIQHLFPVGRQAVIGPTGSFLFRDHNGYDPTTLQFVPAKERWAAGVLARYAPSDRVTFNARVEHVWTHEHENPAPSDIKFNALADSFVPGSTVPVVSSTGWQFVVGATARF